MKTFLLVALVFGSVISTEAQGGSADTTSPSVSASSNPAADADWKKISDDSQHIGSYLHMRNEAGLKLLAPSTRKESNIFATKYPADPHAPQARLLSAQLGGLERRLGMPDAPSADAVSRQFSEISADTSLPQSVRVDAGVMMINAMIESAEANPGAHLEDDIDKRIDAFQKTFGNAAISGQMPGVFVLRQEQVAMLKQEGDTQRLNALLARLANDPESSMATWAKGVQSSEQALDGIRSRAMDLAFTAIDGRKVDLSKLRGKVVLVDFWATWCGPCVAGMPNVLAAYKKYHDQGFEIVGISLDQDKDALEKFVADNHVAWPQYFDGKGWDNAISSHYGIQAIPAMFLLGKDGKLAVENPGHTLEAQIAKLLGSK